MPKAAQQQPTNSIKNLLNIKRQITKYGKQHSSTIPTKTNPHQSPVRQNRASKPNPLSVQQHSC